MVDFGLEQCPVKYPDWFPRYNAWDKTAQRMVEVLSIDFVEGGLNVLPFESQLSDCYLLGPEEYVLLEKSNIVIKKNKKFLCEGDIIQSERGDIHVVRRVLGSLTINSFQDEIERGVHCECISDMQTSGYIEECEIIGNIFENPELVKNRKK